MPNIKSAAKRARTSQLRRLRNRDAKSRIATSRRVFMEAVGTKDKDKSLKLFREYCSILDKSVKRRIITRNTADRSKSRASKRLAAALT
jgi:small subunit ribosomal protein S20